MQKNCSHQTELHLIIPGICGPLSDTSLLAGNHEINRWIKTLAKAKTLESSGNANDVISGITGLKVKNEFPAAVLTSIANETYDDSLYYMHADPVHLRANMSNAVLTSSDDMCITEDESEALLESLNKHFEQDGLHFSSVNEKRWLLSSKEKINLSTTALVDAIGRDVNFILPEGGDAKHWLQLLTEVQMLMFSHGVNLSREQKGQLSINSLWFHGCGELEGYSNNETYRCCSKHDVVKGLSKYMSCEYLQRPDMVDDYMKFLLSEGDTGTQGSVNILHLDELESLVNYTDLEPWLMQLGKTLNNWVYPLLSFSNKNNISLVLYPCNSKKYQFSKYDNLKFWRYRLNNKLDQYVDSYSSIKS